MPSLNLAQRSSTISLPFRSPRGCLLQPLRIQRKPRSQFSHTSLNLALRLFRLGLMNDLCDQPPDLAHLRFFHAARRDRGCADAQARSDEGFVLIEGYGV